jgi:ribosomal protein S5
MRLVAPPNLEHDAAAAVEKAVREVTKDMMSVRTAFFDKINVEENGKFKVVKSKLVSAGDMPDKTAPLS